MTNPRINPNSDKDTVDNLNIASERDFPIFLKKIKFDKFRHINNLEINFRHPISVISGTNKSGKTTVLMALACSHLDFKKNNVINGNFIRHTWSSLMQFTKHDIQVEDWSYYISYRRFAQSLDNKKGQRKHDTKKWNGIGKKESQFDFREARLIDVDRITPARNFNTKIFKKIKNTALVPTSAHNSTLIREMLSYVFEEAINIQTAVKHIDKEIYSYQNMYSSFNSATGEDAISKMLMEIIEAPRDSLILIDEIELSLHPKIQKRFIDVIYYITKIHKKQFVITTHSPSILCSLPQQSRSFISRAADGTFSVIEGISISEALTKMDSNFYPIVDIFCEDDVAELIIKKGIKALEVIKNGSKISDLFNIIVSGSSSATYNNFFTHKNTFDKKKIRSGFACILDGDMRTQRNTGRDLIFQPQNHLHFIYSELPPEKFLTNFYLRSNPNVNIQYHYENSNVHILFEKIVEFSDAANKLEAFELCWGCFIAENDGQSYLTELVSFLSDTLDFFSQHL